MNDTVWIPSLVHPARISRSRAARLRALTLGGATLAALLAGCGDSGRSQPVSYALVTVGDPGNAPDTTGFGSVAYPYRIGKHLVTIAQYATFLNAVAATDTYGLYDLAMATDLNTAGISRSGASGSHRYAAMDNGGDSGNRPIGYVSWLRAARFANWMANGQPSGAQDATTTEDGAYPLHGSTGGRAVPRNLVNPNTGAPPTFSLPLENEWYKAAYYDPELDDGAGGYHLYPTRSDANPGNVVGDAPNQGNYFTSVFSLTQSPDYESMSLNYLTDVGAYTASASFYGTFDQGGALWQWNDLDGASVPYRGLRGGYWFSGSVPMQSVLYSTDVVTRATNDAGFRLVSPAGAP